MANSSFLENSLLINTVRTYIMLKKLLEFTSLKFYVKMWKCENVIPLKISTFPLVPAFTLQTSAVEVKLHFTTLKTSAMLTFTTTPFFPPLMRPSQERLHFAAKLLCQQNPFGFANITVSRRRDNYADQPNRMQRKSRRKSAGDIKRDRKSRARSECDRPTIIAVWAGVVLAESSQYEVWQVFFSIFLSR